MEHSDVNKQRAKSLAKSIRHIDERSKAAKYLATGAAVGAGLGALAGAAKKPKEGKSRLKGALKGAGVGALGGAAVGAGAHRLRTSSRAHKAKKLHKARMFAKSITAPRANGEAHRIVQGIPAGRMKAKREQTLKRAKSFIRRMHKAFIYGKEYKGAYQYSQEN
jgi:hypothetical protein